MRNARKLAVALGAKATYLQSEDFSYPKGGRTRHGRAYYPDGEVRVVYAGIPDTAFSLPAHGRCKGKYLRGTLMTRDDGELEFRPYLLTVNRKAK